MAKVIVERPRHGHRDGYPRGELRVRARDLESAPTREGMGRGYATKGLNENLRPLARYLAQQVGRPWRLVRSEIAARISMASAVQKHVLDHLRQMVVEHAWWQEGVLVHAGRGGGVRPLVASRWRDTLYVCPKTGLLRAAPARRRRPRALPDPDRVVLDATRELRRLDGVWFEVTVGAIPVTEQARLACFDVVERRPPERAGLSGRTSPILWRSGRYAVAKRQLSKRELRAHGLAPG